MDLIYECLPAGRVEEEARLAAHDVGDAAVAVDVGGAGRVVGVGDHAGVAAGARVRGGTLRGWRWRRRGWGGWRRSRGRGGKATMSFLYCHQQDEGAILPIQTLHYYVLWSLSGIRME